MKKPAVSERFLHAFDDPDIFDCGDFNLIKVAQDALIREVGKNGNRLLYFDKPKWFLQLYFRLKAARNGGVTSTVSPAIADKKLLAIIPPRFVPDETGAPKLQYFHRFQQLLPREEIALVYLTSSGEPPVKPDFYLHQILQQIGSVFPDDGEMKFLSELKRCYQTIATKSRFSQTELHHIKTGFEEFWRQYRALKLFFAGTKARKAIIIPGYYTEQTIAALKINGIEVIEVQHGVITPASHFYIYPPKIKEAAKKALFADRIWLFGEFWKQQLLKGSEFSADQMTIVGDYFLRQETPPSDPQQFEAFAAQFPRLLLIGTQTKRHPQFIELISGLSEKYLSDKTGCGIVLKPHPAEDPELYSAVTEQPNVLLTDASLDFLYPRCDAYISMYSNTLFEATQFPALAKYVLRTDETAALAEAVAASGVARILKPGDDPMKNTAPQAEAPESRFFFAPFNEGLIRSLLND